MELKCYDNLQRKSTRPACRHALSKCVIDPDAAPVQGGAAGTAALHPSKMHPIVRALLCWLRCFPEGTTFRITLITQCNSTVRLWRRPYGLHRCPCFACGHPYRTQRRPHRLFLPSRRWAHFSRHAAPPQSWIRLRFDILYSHC